MNTDSATPDQPEPMMPVQVGVNDALGVITFKQRDNRFAIKPTTMTVPLAAVVLAVAQYMERQAMSALGGAAAVQTEKKTASGGKPE